jgi:anti-sigma-K factor RskA
MSEPHAWSDNAAAYALGALDAEERTAFETHLAECAICRAEVESYHDAAGLIGYGAPVMQPPPQLKAKVLAQVKSVRPIHGRARMRRRMGAWLATAAALVIAFSALVLYRNERGRRTLAEADRDHVTRQLSGIRAKIAEQDSLLAAVLSPDAQTATLVAQGRPPSVRLYLNRRRNVVVVAAYDLPPAAAGRTYQLWGIADGRAVSMGMFNTGEDGRAVVALPVTADARFQLSAITDEPAGGSPQPTTAPFIAGPWSD